MITYEFYKDRYLGDKITETAFPQAAARAETYVNFLERQYQVCCPVADSRQMALCAAAEVFAQSGYAHNVSASAVGDVSVHYFVDGGTALKQQLYRAVAQYLQIRRGVV